MKRGECAANVWMIQKCGLKEIKYAVIVKEEEYLTPLILQAVLDEALMSLCHHQTASLIVKNQQLMELAT